MPPAVQGRTPSRCAAPPAKPRRRRNQLQRTPVSRSSDRPNGPSFFRMLRVALDTALDAIAATPAKTTNANSTPNSNASIFTMTAVTTGPMLVLVASTPVQAPTPPAEWQPGPRPDLSQLDAKSLHRAAATIERGLHAQPPPMPHPTGSCRAFPWRGAL